MIASLTSISHYRDQHFRHVKTSLGRNNPIKYILNTHTRQGLANPNPYSNILLEYISVGEVMNEREQRGLVIAATKRIRRNTAGWLVG